MIVHTLKMCTGDAGPEQNLLLFLFLHQTNVLLISDQGLYCLLTECSIKGEQNGNMDLFLILAL